MISLVEATRTSGASRFLFIDQPQACGRVSSGNPLADGLRRGQLRPEPPDRDVERPLALAELL
jgi:hypothetical protein